MKKLFLILAVGSMMSSCIIYKNDIPTPEEAYNNEFVEKFGSTDPNHTWAMVENRSVELNLNKPSQVKVYAQYGKNYHVVANYENVSGNCDLAFDAPMGCTDLHVTVDGMPYLRSGSRTAVFGDKQNVIDTLKTDNYDEKYRYYKFSEIKKFKDDATTLPEYKDNTAKVKKDFRVKSNGGTYKFYPLFWNADYFHTFGLYYYDNGERIEIDFYKDKEGRCLQYTDANGKWKNVETTYAYEGIFAQGVISDDATVLRSRCYTIQNIPKDTEFGFYVIIEDRTATVEGCVGKFYSDPSLNQDPNKSYSTFAYLELDGNTYMTIEDRKNGDLDFNDFIFIIEGEQEHIEENPYEYIYATEDLGGTNDYDFNDIVFSVSHVSGQPHANVKLLAAGGVLPAEIWFNNTKCGEEVHEAFGVETTVMVNTAKGTTKANMMKVNSYTVEVGKEWSHVDAAFTEKGNGFKVKVTKNGQVHEVGTPGASDGEAPQMLVLNPDWLWPIERTSIVEAYSGFGEWGKNYQNKTWVNTVDNSKVINWIAE